jgi:two-component system OmpR family sensor kinase
MNRLPIRARVAAAFAVAMAVVLVSSGWFLYVRLSSHLALELDRELQLRSQDLAALVRQPGAHLAGDNTGRFIERGESYAELLTTDGHVADATRPLGTTVLLSRSELRAARRGPIYADRTVVAGLDEPSRLLAAPVRRGRHRFVLIVGRTRQDNAETLSVFRDELLLAGPIALLLASIAGYLLAGLSLRQVDSMRRRAASVSADNPGERLPVPPTGDELERLGRTLNDMLGRLEAALERERKFVADAGHELRTPLALLRTELELALRYGETPDELRAAIRASSQEVDRLAQLSEDLLLIARSEDGRLPLRVEHVDPRRLLTSVVSRFQWRADAAERALECDVELAEPISGDALRLEQALANMVDNALRHGGGAVRVACFRSNGSIELHVTDEGGGFAPEFVDRAFERFSRDGRGGDPSGAGLGLAIVETIAQAHGGEAHAVNRPGGGADVWLALPDGVHLPFIPVRHDRPVRVKGD